MAREMQFARLELRQIAATLTGAAVGIGLAVADKGAWAIVGQILAEATMSTLLLWALSSWRPSFTFSKASLGRLGGFAGNVFAENVLWQAGRTVAGAMIGRSLGAAALGTYTLATTVILMPFARLAAPLQQVFFPAFSRISDDRERMADIWIRATRLVGAFSIPALVGLIIVAPEFVEVVLGPKWTEATTVIRILAVVGIVQSLHTLNGEVLMALGRAGTLLRYTALWTFATLTAVAIGLQWGLVGVAIAYTIAIAIVEPLRAYVTTRALGIPFLRLVRSLTGVAQATAVMAAVLLVTRELLISAGTPVSLQLVLLILVGGAGYVLACVWRAPAVTAELTGVIGRRRRRSVARIEPLDAAAEL